MQYRLRTISLIGQILILAGCASNHNKNQNYNPETTEGLDPKNLDSLVEKAKGQGDFKKYLLGDLFIKASDASLRGDHETAITLFEHASLLDQKNMYLKKKLAYEYIQSRNLNKSRLLLEELFKSENYRNEKIGQTLAGVYMAMGKQNKAKKTYEKLMTHIKNKDVCASLASIYAREKKKLKANRLLDRCEKMFADQGIFSYLKGKMALKQGMKKLAINHFKNSLKKQTNYIQSALALGIIYEAQGNNALALKTYTNFLAIRPNSISILSRITHILLSQKKYEKGLPYIERLTGLDPDNLNLKFKLGILYSGAGRLRESIGVFKEILTANPESDKIKYHLGTLYGILGHQNNAMDYFNKIDPESSLFLQGRIQIAGILGEKALEGEEVEKFIYFVKSSMETHNKAKVELGIILANFYEKRENIPKAIDILTSIKEEGTFEDKHKYYLASLLEKNASFEDSMEIMEKLLSKNPDDPQALNFLGYTLLERGEQMQRAYRYIVKAANLRPNDGHILDSLGWYYYKIGHYKKALIKLKKAHELVKDDTTISRHLATVYKKLKSYNKAKQFYAKALKHCKVNSERREVLKAMEDLEKSRLPASVP